MLPEDFHKDWKPGDPLGYIQPPLISSRVSLHSSTTFSAPHPGAAISMTTATITGHHLEQRSKKLISIH